MSNSKPVSYLQTDPRWKSISYSAPGESTTIGASGCGPTAMAMVLATWADKAVTPATECRWALQHGWKCPGSGTYYGYFVPAGERYGLAVRRLNAASIYGNSKSPCHDEAKAALDRGDLVIACMGKGNWTSGGHYVLCWQVEGNTIRINDPASTLARRTAGDYSLFKQQVKYYWIIQRPRKFKEEEREEEPDMPEKDVRALVEATQAAMEKKIKALTDENRELRAEIEALKEPVYDTVEECPDWTREAAQEAVDRGVLHGDDKGRLRLTGVKLWVLEVLRRDKKL